MQPQPSPSGAGEPAAGQAHAPAKKLQTKVGRVISDKMDKTVVVAVDRLLRHRLYRHTFRRTTKFLAHDEANEARIGDTVRIVTCRPVSRHKHFKVAEILRRGDIPAVSPREV